MKDVLNTCVFVTTFLIYGISGGVVTTASSNTTTELTTEPTTSAATISTDETSTTVNSTLPPGTLETTNNVTPMIIGIAVGVSVVAVAILVTAITFAVVQKKKVHPSETETIFSDSGSESDYDSRPTTASHIFIDQEDDVPSRPVTMTPFELRKLFVETFPYEKWKPGFDGHLRPRMPLRFVHPSRYRRTKFEETEFRRKIHQFERTENLTISRPPSSTLMHSPLSRARSYSMTTLDPVPERIYQNGVLHTESGELRRSTSNFGIGEGEIINEQFISKMKSSPNESVDVKAEIHAQTDNFVKEINEIEHNNSKGSASNRVSNGSSAKEQGQHDNQQEHKSSTVTSTVEQTQGADVMVSNQRNNNQNGDLDNENLKWLEKSHTKTEPVSDNDHLEVQHYDDIMTTEL